MMNFRSWLRKLASRLGYRISWPRKKTIPHYRPHIEPLEVRVVPSTFIVLNTSDTGAGSLRQALLDANTSSGADTITFNIPTTDAGYDASAGTWTVAPTSALPIITEAVSLDATTQPGYTSSP